MTFLRFLSCCTRFLEDCPALNLFSHQKALIRICCTQCDRLLSWYCRLSACLWLCALLLWWSM